MERLRQGMYHGSINTHWHIHNMERIRHKECIVVLLTLMAHSQQGEVKTQGLYYGFINTHGTFTTWRG